MSKSIAQKSSKRSTKPSPKPTTAKPIPPAEAPKPTREPSDHEKQTIAAAVDYTEWKKRNRHGNPLPGLAVNGIETVTTESIFANVAGSDSVGDMIIEAGRLALVARYALQSDELDLEGDTKALAWVLFMIETRCEAAAELQQRKHTAERLAKEGAS